MKRTLLASFIAAFSVSAMANTYQHQSDAGPAQPGHGLIPVAKVREVAKSLPKGEYVELPEADHFSPYSGPVFEDVVARQTVFFKKNLMP